MIETKTAKKEKPDRFRNLAYKKKNSALEHPQDRADYLQEKKHDD